MSVSQPDHPSFDARIRGAIGRHAHVGIQGSIGVLSVDRGQSITRVI